MRLRQRLFGLAVCLDQAPAGLVDGALPVPHGSVDAVLRKQCRVTAALDHAARLEHDDFIGIDNGRKPVRDDQRRAIAGDLA